MKDSKIKKPKTNKERFYKWLLKTKNKYLADKERILNACNLIEN